MNVGDRVVVVDSETYPLSDYDLEMGVVVGLVGEVAAKDDEHTYVKFDSGPGFAWALFEEQLEKIGD